VPDDALIFRGGENYVPIVRNGRINLTKVILSNDDGREVEIASGLSAGDLIAVNVGLDAPKKAEIMGALRGQQSMTPEKLDLQLARLTSAEQDTFLMLAAKMQGRWVEPPAIEKGSVETTATAVQSNGARS
jgi:hypothetical protein